MSKASDYKEHSEAVKKDFIDDKAAAISDRPLSVRVLESGNLFLDVGRPTGPYYWEGISPDVALRLGRWLVDMYEEKT